MKTAVFAELARVFRKETPFPSYFLVFVFGSRFAETPSGADMMHTKTTAKAILNELKNDLADWMDAKEDLVWRPAIELTREGDEFSIRAIVPGVQAANLEVLVAPEMMLIKGEVNRRKLMRSITFPQPINTDQVEVELKNGVLSVQAEIAAATRAWEFMPRAA